MRSTYAIHGGIHPNEAKALATPGKVLDAGIPDKLVLPLSQHIGRQPEVVVSVGESVKGGQVLALAEGPMSVSLHAPTSGVITAIEDRSVPHPSGMTNRCIELQCDGEDDWLAFTGITDWRAADRTELIEAISNAGIAGMGGAGFPTAVKLNGPPGQSIDTLIINGTECEPYISSDDTLMQVDAPAIVEGADILAHIIGAREIIFAVEDNKPAALTAMRDAVAGSESGCQRDVMTFPTKYPSGGEKQLIEILTGKQVPSGGLPAHLGIVCQNPGTAVAVRAAILEGKPLTERIVTLTGEALGRPGNYRVRLGTPIHHLLAMTEFDPSDNRRLIHGGPMMGFALENSDVPVIKTTNCILVPTEQELPTPPPAQACIRCGLCAEACPASLLPQQLYWYARAKDQEQLEKHHLFDCIECGACSWVCPSHIPLVQYYRSAKGSIIDARAEKVRSDRSRDRFEARQERVERELAAREAQRAARRAAAQKKADTGAEDDPIAAAIARAKAKKQAAEETPSAASDGDS